MTRRARVIVASTRAAAGVYADRGGPIVVGWLAARNFLVTDPVVVADGIAVSRALRAAIAENVDVRHSCAGVHRLFREFEIEKPTVVRLNLNVAAEHILERADSKGDLTIADDF